MFHFHTMRRAGNFSYTSVHSGGVTLQVQGLLKALQNMMDLQAGK